MNFVNSITDRTKNALLKSIASLLEKNPQTNLPKVLKISKLLASDKTIIEMIDNFELSYNEIPELKSYVDDFLMNIDSSILKNFFINILGNNITKNENNHHNSKTDYILHSLLLDKKTLNSDSKDFTYDELDKIIYVSKKAGIFTFIISNYEDYSFSFLYKIFKKYNSCLFIPFINPKNITENSCVKILKCRNVLPLFAYETRDLNILRKNKIPGINIIYLQYLFKKTNFNNDFFNLKAFFLDFNNNLVLKKLTADSLTHLFKTNYILTSN